MTLIKVDANDNKKPSPCPSPPASTPDPVLQVDPASKGSTSVNGTSALITVCTGTPSQSQASDDWHYADDVCATKRAAGGGGYQGDVHANGSSLTSTHENSNDYACGRGLGKW